MGRPVPQSPFLLSLSCITTLYYYPVLLLHNTVLYYSLSDATTERPVPASIPLVEKSGHPVPLAPPSVVPYPIGVPSLNSALRLHPQDFSYRLRIPANSVLTVMNLVLL